MKQTSGRLADGREIIYFDERDDVVRGRPDTRDLPPPPRPSQLRYDPLLEEWVAVATHRQTRTFLPPSDECPLCPSTPDRATEVPEYDYDVVVFENRFPSFSTVEHEAAGFATPLTPTRAGIGRCEVVCFTTDHDASFASLPESRARTVLDVQAERSQALAELPDVEQIFCFENRGIEIGVTLSHPHGQIYAYPFVTPRTRLMLAAARRRPGLFGEVLAAERAAGVRVVAGNEHWTAYVPAAARWPFEVHVVPHRQAPDLPSLTDEERDAFVPLYLDLLRRMDRLFGAPMPMPYISAWHQAPVRGAPAGSARVGRGGTSLGEGRELAWLHLQLFSLRRTRDKLKYLAGSESAMGVFVNDVLPEEAARMFREAGS